MERVDSENSVVNGAELIASDDDGFAAQGPDKVQSSEAFSQRSEEAAGALD